MDPGNVATVNTIDAHAQSLISSIFIDDSDGHEFLTNVPVKYGTFTNHVPVDSSDAIPLYNSELPAAAKAFIRSDWAVYSFSNGHFVSSIATRNFPFHVTLAADPFSEGRALFGEFTDCKRIFSGVNALHDHVRSSGDCSILSGYMIHSHRLPPGDSMHNFWQIQASIIGELRKLRSLSIVLVFVHPDHDGRVLTKFQKALRINGWITSSQVVAFPDCGDSIDGQCSVILAVHNSTDSNALPISLKQPPQVPPSPIAPFIWTPFNQTTNVVSFGKDDKAFNSSIVDNEFTGSNPDIKMIASTPKAGATTTVSRPSSQTLYNLHCNSSIESIVIGSSVLSLNGLCPVFCAEKNDNLFGHYFGIEFKIGDRVYVRPISSFEFVRCFGLNDDLTYKLSLPQFKFSSDSAIPARTSVWILDHVDERLRELRDSSVQVFDPSQYAAPVSMCQTFVNGAIGDRLPNVSAWKSGYAKCPEMALLVEMINMPSKITKKNLLRVNHNFRGPLRQSLIVIESDMLVLREPHGSGSSDYTKLRIVPPSLRNALFICFHANPIGGHLNAHLTHSRLRLRFYWPGMFTNCTIWCKQCPGCALANQTHRVSELCYKFPVEAPFLVLHVDGFQAGAHSNFEGSDSYPIASDSMTSFACMEPITTASATTFASGLMKIMMRFGICHTLVLDKDSKFLNVFKEVVELLQLNCHILSATNHNGMLVERINRYLNKGLRILCNERDSVRVALEAILMLLYAWNSAPIAGTDLSRSLVAVGREFSFPIDFSASKHLELTSSPESVQSYAKTQAELVGASRDIAKALLEVH